MNSSDAVASCGDPDSHADHVAIVFVHGVGFQDPGDTLLGWSSALIRAIRDQARLRSGELGPDPVLRSMVDLSGSTRPVVEIALDTKEHWVLTEAYWASSIRPPSLGEILRWLLIEGGIERAVDHLQRLPGPRVERIWTVKRLFVSLIGAAALLAYGAVRAVAGLVPGSRSGVIGSIDGFLTAWSGDMRVLLFDEVQSAVVLNRVAAAVKSLDEFKAKKVVLLAHSGGAVASYMSLAKYGELRVTDLVTFGQGLNIAWRLAERHREASGGRAALLARPISTKVRPVRWTDYWATEDPVPNLGLRPPDCVRAPRASRAADLNTREAMGISLEERGIPISNSWSIAQDHGGYWENDEEFVLPLLRRLALRRATGTPGTSTDVRSRLQRVSALAMWRHLAFFSGLCALIIATLIVAYYSYLAPHTEEAGFLPGVVLWLERGFAYWADPSPSEALRVGDFRGGPVRALGVAVQGLWHAIPGTGMFTAPVEALRQHADSLLIAVATNIGLMLGPFLLFLGALNAWPNTKRWLRPWPHRSVTRPISVALWSVAVIAFLGAIVAYLGLLSVGVGVGTSQQPHVVESLWALAIGGAAFGLSWLLGHTERFKLAADVAQWWLVLLLLATLPLAMLVEPGYGIFVLGAVVTLVVFQLVAGVGAWRWRSWDVQERWQARTGMKRRYGRGWDFTEAGALVIGLFAFATGFGLLDLVPSLALIALAIGATLFLTVTLVGVRRDFANTTS